MTNLTKRKKAERRFQFYGIFAVGLSLLFVLVLILNIFFAGIGGFFKTSFIIPFHFDQNLLKIDENYSIHIDKSIDDKEYMKLDGKSIRLPINPDYVPSKEALIQRFEYKKI